MSNKETLQSYNSRLSTNNNDLSSILDTISNLPTSGGGGGATEPYMEETYNDSLELISARLYGYEVLRKNMFNGSTYLVDVDIPNTVKIIRQNALAGCRAITDVVFPASVETIETQAFSYAYGLRNITFLGTPTSIATDVFKNCTSTDINIYVPWSEGMVANAPWGCTGATIHYNYKGEV